MILPSKFIIATKFTDETCMCSTNSYIYVQMLVAALNAHKTLLLELGSLLLKSN